MDVGISGMPPLDLSEATRLKDLSFRCEGSIIQQFTMALQTVQPEHLQQITIHPYVAFADPVEERVSQEWQDLDRLLVQFWTLRSIRPKIKYGVWEGGNGLRALAPSLLPELTRRGLVDWLINTDMWEVD
jgi:hypothetical protein